MKNSFEALQAATVTPDYRTSDFVEELHNLNMVRLGMSIKESSRSIVDTIRDIEYAVANDISAIEYFHYDLGEGEAV